MARIARSLDTLRTQINTLHPQRKKASDGWLGDAAHAARKSDHNPNSLDVVCALDITHDPANGVDSYKLAEVLKANKDPRIKYVISNKKIFSNDWQWRKYTGSNPHSQHVHVSVGPESIKYDDPSPWKLDGTGSTTPVVKDITVKISFNHALPLVLKHEGGYVDHPADPGGATNKGITIGTYRQFINRNGTKEDLKNITDDQVRKIYKERYWDPMGCDQLPVGLDYCIFDYGVNSGINRAPKVLQRILNVDPDGAIGPNTIEALKGKDVKLLINAVCDERMSYLKTLKHWPTFGKGWTTRVAQVRVDALNMVTDKTVSDVVKQEGTTIGVFGTLAIIFQEHIIPIAIAGGMVLGMIWLYRAMKD